MTADLDASGRRFEPGRFAPTPGANAMADIVRALSWLELKLFLRNGEQLTVNVLIPITALIVLCLAPIGSIGVPRAAGVVPAVLASAIMSSALTGQAIAVGFDRRYGVLKRLGATIAPPWAVIVGKSAAVVTVVVLQCLLLGGIGVMLGWHISMAALCASILIVAVGAAAFAAMGLLLGGSLRAEIVLPLANVLWFAQMGICAVTVFTHPAGAAATAMQLSPAGALALGLRHASHGDLDTVSLLILGIWFVAAAWAAKKTFRFT